MFNLVKNELIKIFSKKAIYIILVIYVVLSIIGMTLTKTLANLDIESYFIDEQIKLEKDYLGQIDKSTEEGKQMYSMTKAEIEYLELQKKYGENSWQATIIENKLHDIIADINYYRNNLNQYVSNEKSLQELEEEYNSIISKLDTDDWKAFAEHDLQVAKQELEFNKNNIKETTDVNTQKNIRQEIDLLQIQIQVLEWRLEKNICYGDDEFDNLLKQYEDYSSNIIYNNYTYDINENNYKQIETKDFGYNEKLQYQNILSESNIARYKIENNISGNTTASESLQSLFTGGGNGLLFVIIIAIMLTGTTISDEFNKGTIKLLLVRPYSRRKILASKLIACLVTLIISILVITIIEIIFSGFTYGFDTINVPAIIYNYNTNSIVTMNVFMYMLINLLKILPLIIILALVAFVVATLSANTAVAIVIAFLVYFVSNIVNQLTMLFQSKWIMIIPTLNWDLTQYSYGHLPTIEGMNLGFSITICAVTIISLLVIAFEAFTRKNIKNV